MHNNTSNSYFYCYYTSRNDSLRHLYVASYLPDFDKKSFSAHFVFLCLWCFCSSSYIISLTQVQWRERQNMRATNHNSNPINIFYSSLIQEKVISNLQQKLTKVICRMIIKVIIGCYKNNEMSWINSMQICISLLFLNIAIATRQRQNIWTLIKWNIKLPIVGNAVSNQNVTAHMNLCIPKCKYQELKRGTCRRNITQARIS